MSNAIPPQLATDLLDILPNPVLVKNQYLEYVWINRAFEALFEVTREEVMGKLDTELFPNRQVAQCNGGDLRVLDSGEVDEAMETVFDKSGTAKEMITRKSKLTISNSEVYLVGVMHDITDITHANTALKVSQKKLEEQALELSILATTDAMTGCSNRRLLLECEKTIISNTKQSAAILAIDIDKFKAINDKYGHECGDTVLRHFCDLTRTILDPQDHFIRLGGEEFAIVIAGITHDEAARKADSLRQMIETSVLINNGKKINFTISIGAAFKDEGVTGNIEDMLRTADVNLYQAKNNGRNQVVLAA